MALKKTITKDEHAALDDAVKALYKEVGENFIVDLEGDEEEKFRNKHRIAEDHRSKAEKRVSDLEAELETAKTDLANANKGGDKEALDRSWQAKYDKLKTESAAELEKAQAPLRAMLVDQVALTMAQEIFSAPELLSGNIAARLTVEMVDGKPTTRVLGADGKLSSLTLDELKAEFVGDKKFESVIIAGKGTGGSTRGSPGSGGAGQKKLSDMTEAERIAWHQKDPVGFKAATDKAARESQDDQF